MESISLYLKKFTNLLPQDFTLKESVRTILKDLFKKEIPQSAIVIKGHTIFIKNIEPMMRLEIIMHQEKILERLYESFKNPNPIKIH